MNGSKFLLEEIIRLAPGNIYWKDSSGKYLGCNENVAKSLNLNSPKEIVGKTNDQLFEKSLADLATENDRGVIQSEAMTTFEEQGLDAEGHPAIYLTRKTPIKKNNKVVGLIGISIDVTDKRNAEKFLLEKQRLEQESEYLKKETELKIQYHQTLAEEQAKFLILANQVAHDIRSPLSSLLMIVKGCKEIPEESRIALREAAINIGDIANNLLNQYKKKNSYNQEDLEKSKPMLVSSALLEMLTEKKYQYTNFPIKFNYHFNHDSYFSFIKIYPNSFKRMISNLINNAVDAFEGKKGQIKIKLSATEKTVNLIIEDNGKGMPAEIVAKILANEAVTNGKKHGHGIGLTQVRETLKNHQGEMNISSTPNIGTTISLIFPRMRAPDWICDEIRLNTDDIVVILDDDTSIHGAWKTHFAPMLAKHPSIQIHHFDLAESALNFLNNISENVKPKIFLLTDFELLKQEMTGLDVIEKSKITRSILVTSHYANKKILKNAAKSNTKILPKQLASEVPTYINEVKTKMITPEASKADVVLVDDNEVFTFSLKMYAFKKSKVDTYQHPQKFLDNLDLYALDTKIYLDCNFAGSSLRGPDIAEILHEKGFINIFLLSGEHFEEGEIPDYVTVILKENVDCIVDYL